LHIILVDDESTDGTADIARKVELENLQIIRSEPLPSGWTGKLWAQEQGLQVVQTSLVLQTISI
jgi:glycosyltransferase involved in cell wall biosynthesis